MRTALIIGGGVLAVYFLTRGTAAPAVPAPSAAGQTGVAPRFGTLPPGSIQVPNANPISLSGAVALSNAGCSAVASSKGVPSSLATFGCKAYSLVTPLGLASAGIKQVERIPVVGKEVKAVGGVISGAASSAYHSIASIF